MLALGTAVAQNPAVVQKTAQTAVASAQAQSTGAKPSPATVKVVPVAQKPAVVAVQPAQTKVPSQPKPVTVAATKPVASQAKPVAVAVPVKTGNNPATKPVAVSVAPQKNSTTKAAPVAVKAAPASAKAAAVKSVTPKVAQANSVKTKVQVAASPKKDSGQTTVAEDKKTAEKPASKPVGQAGRRDPFVSPVVSMGAVGSGCSSGKRCLTIDQISLKGIVRSDNGMIAVVVNASEKAYFLRENDPVFNGYVEKITGDSIVFKESFHDRLGKPLTRDITKSIRRPVA
jgi:Tfp pilus assembly protein PilP